MHEHNSNTIASMSLDDLIQLWTTYRQPVSKSVRVMTGVVRQFKKFTEVEALNEIKQHHFIDWRDHLLDTKGLRPTTWNNYLKHMRVLLRFAKSQGWRSIAVMNGIKTVPETGVSKKTIDHEVLTKVVHWLEHEQDYNVNPGWFWVCTIKTLFFTGVRRRQFVGLRWGDIDTERMQIKLVAEHSKTKRGWSIPLHPALLPVLEELRSRTEHKLKHPLRRDDQLFNVNLFYTRADKNAEMTEDQLSSAFTRINKHTGVRISSHRFRHTFATNLANQNDGNVNIKNVQQILGHTNVSTTLGYVQPDMKVMRGMMGGLPNEL